jgi:hypothetical protein
MAIFSLKSFIAEFTQKKWPGILSRDKPQKALNHARQNKRIQ